MVAEYGVQRSVLAIDTALISRDMQKILNKARERVSIYNDTAPSIGVSDEFINKTLKLYHQHTTCLKSARIFYCEQDYKKVDSSAVSTSSEADLVTIVGRLSFSTNCIRNDGKDFTILQFGQCYHQLVYILLGQCIFDGYFSHLDSNSYGKLNLSFSNYFKQQLFSIIIVKMDVNFLQPLNCRNFDAELVIKNIIWNGETAIIYTYIAFCDAMGKKSDGYVQLALKTLNSL